MINIIQNEKKCQDAGFGYFIENCLYYSADIVVQLFDISNTKTLIISHYFSDFFCTKQCTWKEFSSLVPWNFKFAFYH